MLQLKFHKYTHPHANHNLELSPITPEDDELLRSIENAHEETMQLDAQDARELDSFWTGVVEDIEKDPTWFRFSDDDA